MKALILQGLTGRPNYFGLLNNLMTLIICESLREIGEMACVTSAWSSRGQTLNANFDQYKWPLVYTIWPKYLHFRKPWLFSFPPGKL